MKLDFELMTERLYLRPYKNADVLSLVDAIHTSQEALSPWLTWCTPDYDQHDAHEWIHASQQNWLYDVSYEFAIFDRETDEFVGSTALSNLSELGNSGELGYWIRESAQRRGFATEACAAISQFAFLTVGLTRLEIVTHTGNLASQRTALACRAQFECTARNRIVMHDKVVNGLLFSLIPTDIL
ncbi:GNAT family N-acetyltransferase [Photobacterium aphoticum]|uniref:Acetyltransferase n=1 Tax=Photobacterium aphoticum TaxID=754436 RepID=A0A090QTG4_9GAMM|nr:GNAT family N-acetyltransferase [Photobacterium aphoticum]KLV01070.1 acetyltransferase [Photobacterium aphoticum]PSU57610.1 N-acetyltransferase [Photobacterium aphoticum]GAL05129.1 putative ribosomal-protein-serine acetyltransferase [Photobacterium aphoticum]GHA37619.1 acetyltransferase [Photobacterium aphoticum]